MNLPVGQTVYMTKKDFQIKLAQAAFMGAVNKPKEIKGAFDSRDLHEKSLDIADVIIKQLETTGKKQK